ncbi:MAG: HD domain-containing protein, partial [Acidobacteriales bacterium]|nr:HD domain-containing protein [Terriglobales bacterium]
MSVSAKLFISAVVSLGILTFAGAMFLWQGRSLTEFLLYLCLALLAAGFKVKVPKLNGTMSVNFPFILISIAVLDPAQTMIIACASICLQCFVKVKNSFSALQTLFNLTNVALAVQVAQVTYHSPYLAFAPAARLFAAALAYFVVNTVNVAVVIALTQGKRPDRVWFEFFFWSYPYYLLSAGLALVIHRLATMFGLGVVVGIVPVAYGIYHAYKAYLGRLEDQRNHAERIAELHLRTIEALALAIEAKDQTTHQHLNRVRTYACALADKLGISGAEKDAIRAASLLHDIGKLAVPEHIISKPGRLTPEEFEKMKIHPVVGADILKTVEFPYPVVPIVRSHHERWDGAGYPDGLVATEIPMGARIISIVDCFDAIASD